MLKIQGLALAMTLMLSASAANAALYTFTQTGFEEGAVITGTIEGVDLNGDSLLTGGSFSHPSNASKEITAFTLSWSGNSLVEAFTQTFSELSYFSFRLTEIKNGLPNYQINRANEAIATNWPGPATTGFLYEVGTPVAGGTSGFVQSWATGLSSSSGTYAVLAPAAVPVPGAVWLFGSALAGLLSLKRRKA